MRKVGVDILVRTRFDGAIVAGVLVVLSDRTKATEGQQCKTPSYDRSTQNLHVGYVCDDLQAEEQADAEQKRAVAVTGLARRMGA